MFTPLSRFSRQNARILHVVIIFALLFQTFLPNFTPSVSAASLPTSLSATNTLSSTQAVNQTTPIALNETQFPTQTLSVQAKLQLDSLLIHPGETTALTLTVQSEANHSDLVVELILPTGLGTPQGQTGAIQWNIPALASGDSYTQVVPIQVNPQTLTTTHATLPLTVTVDAPHYAPVTASTLLGVAPTTTSEPGDVVTAPQTAQGTALENASGEVTLLVAPDTAPTGMTFVYTELYDVTDALTTTRPSTVSQELPLTPTITFVNAAQNTAGNMKQTFLPFVVGNDNHKQAAATTQVQASAAPVTTTLNSLPGFVQNGIHIYKMWRFDALQANQKVNQFDGKEVMVAVSARSLIAQGINPKTLNLWTRPDASKPWTLVHSEYDPAQQLLKAWLPHFSEFSLGQGLTNADILPSVKGFTSDRVTGAATLQYAIETPKGLGGLTPNLSFSYSSLSIDDLFQNGGNDGNQNTAQVSGVGAGWNLGGLSRIVRAGGSLDKDTFYKDREYVLALNGNFVRIKYENNAWRTDPEIFAKIERPNTGPGTTGRDMEQWIITTVDGTRYTFGDSNMSGDFSDTMATGTFVDGGGRLAKEWQLVQVSDTLGNRIDYHYKAEQGQEDGNNGCVVPSNRPDLHWYVSAIYPTEILWSSHTDASQAAFDITPKLRVEFVYSPTERADWQIEGSAQDDCQQAKFGKQNQLTQVLVEAAVQTSNNIFAWQTLRSYTLLQRYGEYRTVVNESKCYNRLLLEGIEERGANGGLLQRHTFTYENDGHRNEQANCLVGLNAVRLSTADNGAGGKMHYTYQAHRISCANSVCGDIQKHQRVAVVKMDIEDGLGNIATTTYCYGPTDTDTYGNPYCADNSVTYRCESSQPEWGAVENSGEYMGFCRSEATYFALNATNYAPDSPAIGKWDQMDTWQGGRDRPDPRRGKLKRQEVRTRPNGDLLAVTTNTWQAYRHAYSDCFNAAGVLNNVGVWCMEPTKDSFHKEKNQTDEWETVYHTLWVRLEATDEWTGGVGKLTKQLYQSAHQTEATNNPVYQSQFGNVTEVQEWSHAEAYLDYTAWQTRVITQTAQLQQLRTTVTDFFPISDATRHLVNKPARVRIYAGANTGTTTGCQAETRTIYDDVNGNYNTPPVKGFVAKTDQAITSCSDTPAAMYSTLWAETRMAYDAYGNQTVLHHVGGGNTTDRSTDEWINTTYDSIYHLFPIQQQQVPTNFTETASYYGVNGPVLSDSKAYWGAMAEHCGINGVCTRQAYDEFGRRLRRWDGVAAPTAWWSNNTQDIAASVRWDYRDPARDTAFKTTVITEWHAPRCEGNFVRKHYNGLGELIAEQKPDQVWQVFAPSEGCNNSSNLNDIETIYGYDSLGNQVRASAPYRTSADWVQRINTLDWQQVWQNRPNTQTQYDALSRPITQTIANGEMTVYQYHGREAKAIGKGRAGDPDKLVKWQETDALGQPRYVRTGVWNGTDWAVDGQVTLTHDVLGNLTCVYQPFATSNPTTNPNCSTTPAVEPAYGVVALAYDRLGHKTSMFDGDLGGWYYQYDRQGHLYYQAGGTKYTCLYYDTFGRLKGKLFQGSTSCSANPDPNTLNVRFTYDEAQSATNASLGQLTSVAVYSVTNGSLLQTYLKNVRYDSQGRLASEAVTIQGAGKTYTTTYTYDAYQRPQAVLYPDGEVVTTTYNSMGLASTLRSNIAGLMVDGVSNGGAAYDEAGRLTAMRFPAGGNLWHTNTYAPWGQADSNGGLLTNIAVGATPGGQERLNLAYTYDSFGNVKTLSDAGSTFTFAYDAQNRLGSAFGQTYTYDPAGRMTSYEGSGLTADAIHPHAMRPTGGYGYDTTGNLTYKPGRFMYHWDPENHLKDVTDSTSYQVIQKYGYDADGQRVKTQRGSIGAFYVNQYFEDERVINGGVAAAGVSPDSLLETVLAPDLFAHQLFLPLVNNGGDGGNSQRRDTPYYADRMGLPCTAGTQPDCQAWVVTTPITATVTPPQAQFTLTATVKALTWTVSTEQWHNDAVYTQVDPPPTDQTAAPTIDAEPAVRAASVLTVPNPGFQTTGNWTENRADSNISPNYPGTGFLRSDAGWFAGHDNADDASTHFAYSINNLAYGWLESTSIAVTANTQYDLYTYVKANLDTEASSDGRWFVRAQFYDNASQALGATDVVSATAFGGDWRQVGGRFTTPANTSKVKIALGNMRNAGWVLFDDVKLTLANGSTNLAPNAGFESTTNWTEVRSPNHPNTAFLRTNSGALTGRTGYGYSISNLASGWLESPQFNLESGYSEYELDVAAHGEIDPQNSAGDVKVAVEFYNSANVSLGVQTVSLLTNYLEGHNLIRDWQIFGVQPIAPSGATKARIRLYNDLNAGWVTFDNVTFHHKITSMFDPPATDLAATWGGFEQSGYWTAYRRTGFTGTGLQRSNAGTAAGLNGYGYLLSNNAHGYLQSAWLPITPGQRYKLSAWLHGQTDAADMEGGFAVRAVFAKGATNNTNLGSQTAVASSVISTTWQTVDGIVIAPSDATAMAVQLWATTLSGWVAFDDVNVKYKDDGVLKYYYFNGQRIAMREGSVTSQDSRLYYLHTDHLNSTFLTTDATGQVVKDDQLRYNAYGRMRAGDLNALPTEYTFTGQRQDNTGLIYMNARYYDPELGQFISPDTLTPDPSDVFDYNRYMYGRGNPIRYNDPSGHCIWDGCIAEIAIASALIGGGVGGGWFAWNESHQADGLDLSVSVNSKGLHLGNDWGDFGTATGLGAVSGALIGVGGGVAAAATAATAELGLSVSAIGTSMASNQAANLFIDSLTGDNFSATNYTIASITGAATGFAGPIVGKLATELPSVAAQGKVIVNSAKILADGLSQGAINGAGSYLSGAMTQDKTGDWTQLPGDLTSGVASSAYGVLQDFGPNQGWAGVAWQTFIGTSGQLNINGFRQLFNLASCNDQQCNP